MSYQILDAPVRNIQKLSIAGFWIRVAATIIDLVVVSTIVITFAFVLYRDFRFWLMPDEFYFGAIALWIVYHMAMDCSSLQGALGKAACRIRVVDANGDRISVGIAIGRSLLKAIFFVPLGLGSFWLAFDEQKQGLHDKVAGTYVVYR